MSREQYIKTLIKERHGTIKDFAREIDMPYSTLLSILNSSIGSAGVTNAMRICRGLGITISDLQRHAQNPDDDLALTETERLLLVQYRLHPEMHAAIARLLDMK